MRKFFLLVCLLTLFACGVGDQEAESTVSMGSPDGYAVSCAANFVRAAPHFCRTTATSSTLKTWVNNVACTQQTISFVPANTTVLGIIKWRSLSNNVVGARNNQISLYGVAGCGSASLGTYSVGSYEYVATVAGTIIHEGFFTMLVPVDSTSSIYMTHLNAGGNGNSEFINLLVLGYYD